MFMIDHSDMEVSSDPDERFGWSSRASHPIRTSSEETEGWRRRVRNGRLLLFVQLY